MTVDIAAIPLNQHILDMMEDKLEHLLPPWYTDGEVARLQGCEVIKNGARSGVSSGVITDVDYWYNGPDMRGEYIIIRPSIHRQPHFALPGDSGSLVSDLEGKPIGLIVKHWKDH